MRRAWRQLVMAAVAALVPLAALGQGPPEWFLAHIEHLTAEGGRWLTDNSEYRSVEEPYDAFGLEWEAGLGGVSLKGRLFALRDGAEVETFWELRSVWHPGEKRVHAYQWGGNGVYAEGTTVWTEGDVLRTEQEFFGPASSFRVGHEEWVEDGKIHTVSYDIGVDGSWKKRRIYVWARAGEP